MFHAGKRERRPDGAVVLRDSHTEEKPGFEGRNRFVMLSFPERSTNMVIRGHFQNGVIVPDEPVSLPEGASVRIEIVAPEPQKVRRRGGMWKGQVVIADDFDALPPELAEAFGGGKRGQVHIS